MSKRPDRLWREGFEAQMRMMRAALAEVEGRLYRHRLEQADIYDGQRPDTRLVEAVDRFIKTGSNMTTVFARIEKLAKGVGVADTVLVKLYSGGVKMSRSKSDKAAKRAAQEILQRAIVPDAGDAAKRGQAYSDWQMLYRALRRPIVGDPRFTLGR
jgi:hypothetical protein